MTILCPRVSAVMPIFNGEKFIAEAIESVLAQTFQSWELILVDDGSSDGSLSIANAYVTSYPGKIHLLHHPDRRNQGTAATRNLGIAHARGEFIGNIDQDDIWGETKVEEQVAILENHPGVAMTFGPMMIWSSWHDGVGAESDRVQAFTFETNTLFRPPSFIPLLLSGKNDPHGYLARKSAIDGVGGYVDNLGICEDWALYVKIALTHEIFVARNSNYYYRQHAAQTCSLHRQTGEFYSGCVPFFDWLRGYLAQRKIADRQILRAFRAAVRRNQMSLWREVVSHRVRHLLTKYCGESSVACLLLLS